MTSKQKRRVRLLLSRKKDQARRRYALRHAEIEVLSAETNGDFSDKAVRVESLEMQLAIEDHDLSEFQSLEEAQGRLEFKDFGCCRVCKGPIRISRLLSVPETSLCYACAVALERREQLPAHITEASLIAWEE
jgi:RNA polymerase-binding transcription factor DksA